VKTKVADLQETKVEFALSVGTLLDAFVRLCRGNYFQRFSVLGVEHLECELVPVNHDGKVVPGLGGERGGEQYVQAVIQDLDIPCASCGKFSGWLGERRPLIRINDPEERELMVVHIYQVVPQRREFRRSVL